MDNKTIYELIYNEIVGCKLVGENPFGPLWHAGWMSCRDHLLKKIEGLKPSEVSHD